LDEKGNVTGNACFASGWYDYLAQMVNNVISYTNISVLETDGPYGGYSCSSKSHSHHEDQDDSIYWQNKMQVRVVICSY
jgi:hypothetical protein